MPTLVEPTIAAAGPTILPPAEEEPRSSLWRDLLIGVATQSWLASMVFHMALMVILALGLGTIHLANTIQGPEFEAIEDTLGDLPEIARFEVGYTPPDPSELTTESLAMVEAPSVEAQFNDNSPDFQEAPGGVTGGDSAFGGLGNFNIIGSGMGPLVKGVGGVGVGEGFGKAMGSGGEGVGFNTRGTGSRAALLGSGGGTKQSERAVAAALNWFARHQNRDGSWSIAHTRNCKGGFCSGPGEEASDTGATALALLPFFAAGQTHESTGPYQKEILRGINWLVKNKKPTGDLNTNGRHQMYSHALATIALCEAYGMTNDSRLGYAAQEAINFIESGQSREGSWRYKHGDGDNDTSVFGWMVMALKSGQMAGLKVNPGVLQACKKYLTAAARGRYGSEFAYMPSGGPKHSMSGVGLLTSQYLGAKRDDAVMIGGVEYLMQNKPTLSQRDSYYWYYATQVMHNMPGKEWDEWNRQMRRILIETQEKTGCAAGSWDPHKPEPEPFANHGGRLMVTSLSTLTLEVYYRYLPLYQLDKVDKELTVVK